MENELIVAILGTKMLGNGNSNVFFYQICFFRLFMYTPGLSFLIMLFLQPFPNLRHDYGVCNGVCNGGRNY